MVIAGRYELQEVAGTGGMAVVWRGETLGAAGFRRPVAIKRILPNLVQEESFITMFVEEARVGSKLQHPNIVQIHDFGEDERGDYFLVMEWVDGLDLRRHLYAYYASGDRPPWSLVAAITIEVLRALSAAHERAAGPVIHRDVNPQNILVSDGGVVKLMDFGLSRAMDRGRITNPDIIKGKLAYMAPEIAFGAEATPLSDLFSVGVVLWEALSGRRLFTGQTDVEVILGVRKAQIPPLVRLRPDLPPELCALVGQALAHEPGARFASADAMGRALAGLLREVDQRTDAVAIARSVADARERLRRLPPPVPLSREVSLV